MNHKFQRILQSTTLVLILCFYLLYVGFIIINNQGPVDYETFMGIGQRFLTGQPVYTENSFYPLPYVMVFAFFSWLPRPLSMALWLLLPVAAALWIVKGKPWGLLFGPMLSHFLGGQSALFGLVGFWGYRKNPQPDCWRGGMWLAITFLKPQLSIVAFLWAAAAWWKAWRSNRRIPKQFTAWVITMTAIYLPSFVIYPTWPMDWLAHPRPFFERALAGFLSRTLILFLEPGWLFTILLVGFGAALIWLVNQFRRSEFNLDLWNLIYFVLSPFVHDYDVIQLIPTIEDRRLQTSALLLSIPLWGVILFAYANDAAWYAVTLIPLGLLASYLIQDRRTYPESSAGSPPRHRREE